MLLHSSKTMRTPPYEPSMYQEPRLLARAEELVSYIKTLSPAELESHMHVSPAKAAATKILFEQWSHTQATTAPALDAFLGDIYSGLQVASFDTDDRAYANRHLLILSGLYGGLRACDSVSPYRLEMGYKLPDARYRNLYAFWGDAIARLVAPETTHVVNLSAVEYTKALLPYLDMPIIAPAFLTKNPKTGEPGFVTVHAKIARGAFAHWMIKHRIDTIDKLPEFDELGYVYDIATSTPERPVFVCEAFGGLGLSVRKA